MDTLKEWGIHYISNRRVKENDAVMFDIDDTLLFVNGLPNKPIIELLNQAAIMGYNIIIITARPGIDRVVQFTINQLANHKIGYHYLGFTSPETKILMKQKLPYKFILSVGDMETDLTGSEHSLNTSNFYHN